MDVIFNVVAGTIIICVLVLDHGGTFFFPALVFVFMVPHLVGKLLTWVLNSFTARRFCGRMLG